MENIGIAFVGWFARCVLCLQSNPALMQPRIELSRLRQKVNFPRLLLLLVIKDGIHGMLDGWIEGNLNGK